MGSLSPNFHRMRQRESDNPFTSVHCVKGKEPGHKELGSFIMGSKYLCSFFLKGDITFIILSSQLHQTNFSCFWYTKSPMSSGKAIITGTFSFKFRDILTLQLQTCCFLAGAPGFVFSGWFRIDLCSSNLLWGPLLLWGNYWLLPSKHLKFLLRFILRDRGVFLGNNADHKNVCRFLWVSFSLSIGSTSTAL